MQTASSHDAKSSFAGRERRKFFRFPYVRPARFCGLNEALPKSLHVGKCKNLSQGGIKISALAALERNSIVLLDLDLNALSVFIRIDQILVVSDRRLLAEVVWRHLNLQTSLFEAGLRFLESSRRSEYEPLVARAAAI